MEDNNFFGELPEELGFLQALQVLNLRDNNFRGTVPDVFQNFSNLNELYLTGNNFEGTMPQHIAPDTDSASGSQFPLLGSDPTQQPKVINLAILVPVVGIVCCIFGLFCGRGGCRKEGQSLDFTVLSQRKHR